MQYTYDWEAGEWVSVPVGVQVGLMTEVAKQPMPLFLAPQYNLRDVSGAPRTVVQFGLALLMP